MANGKRYPAPQTPPVPRKPAVKLAQPLHSDVLGLWLDAVHGNTTWSTRGNGTYLEKVKAS